LETVTDFGEFPGRQVDPLLLYFRALLLGGSERLLSVGTLLQRLQLGRHLLHGVGEFGQLSGDARYVIGGCDSAAILWMLHTASGVEDERDLPSARLRPVGDALEIESSTHADHRQLGMLWSPLGILRAPSKLIVIGGSSVPPPNGCGIEGLASHSRETRRRRAATARTHLVAAGEDASTEADRV
jgi:hypothetical protein